MSTGKVLHLIIKFGLHLCPFAVQHSITVTLFLSLLDVNILICLVPVDSTM